MKEKPPAIEQHKESQEGMPTARGCHGDSPLTAQLKWNVEKTIHPVPAEPHANGGHICLLPWPLLKSPGQSWQSGISPVLLVH